MTKPLRTAFSDSLLPNSASTLEKQLAHINAQGQALNVDLSILWNPERCPVDLLPFLAWAFSVDYWQENWLEEKKRAVIKNAFYLHKHKGTIGAIKRAIEPFGFLTEFKEWFEHSPQQEVGTFSLSIEVPQQGLSEDINNELVRLIDSTKPVSRHIKKLSISLTNRCHHVIGAAIQTGSVITIYPK